MIGLRLATRHRPIHRGVWLSETIFGKTPPPPPADTGAVRTVMDDVQSRQDGRRLAIDKVGIRGLAHPVQVHDRSQALQHTVAPFSMAVDLPQHVGPQSHGA